MVVFWFVIGSIFGSFLNNLGFRISKHIENLYDKNYSYFKELIEEIKLLKLVNDPKRSQCPVCKTELKWYDNIPVFSYLLLKGKCKYCGARIPFFYFLSEIFLGALTALLYYKLPFNQFIVSLGFAYALWPAVVVDNNTRYIPEIFLFLALPFFLFESFLINPFYAVEKNVVYSLILIFGGFGIIYGLYKLTKKIYFGFGDIKLLALFNLVLGIKKTIIVLFLANYIAFPFLIWNLIKKRDKAIDFGLYLYIAFFLIFLYYEKLKVLFFKFFS